LYLQNPVIFIALAPGKNRIMSSTK